MIDVTKNDTKQSSASSVRFLLNNISVPSSISGRYPTMQLSKVRESLHKASYSLMQNVQHASQVA